MIATVLLAAALQTTESHSESRWWKVIQYQSSQTPLSAAESLTAATTNEARFDAVAAQLRARNIPFTVERFTIEKPIGKEPRTEGRNIVVSFPAATTASGRLVVGAHYDAVRLEDGSLSHGAVDNAGSTAVLIQIAERFKTQPPQRPVTLVWFDMEELGLIGSAKYAEAHRAEGIGAMINLDINAYGDTVIFGKSRTPANATLRRAVLETCTAIDVVCVGLPEMPPGDDRSFAKAGIPAVSIATLSAVEAHKVWLLFNAGASAGLSPDAAPAVLETIHTANDTLDKVDGDALSRIADLVSRLVARVTDR